MSELNKKRALCPALKDLGTEKGMCMNNEFCAPNKVKHSRMAQGAGLPCFICLVSSLDCDPSMLTSEQETTKTASVERVVEVLCNSAIISSKFIAWHVSNGILITQYIL